jgi:hypothetical protein
MAVAATPVNKTSLVELNIITAISPLFDYLAAALSTVLVSYSSS